MQATPKCSPRRLQPTPKCSTRLPERGNLFNKNRRAATPAVAEDSDGDDNGSDFSWQGSDVVSTSTRGSFAGDDPASADEDEDPTAVAARHPKKMAPLAPRHSDCTHGQWSGSARQNSEPHVGNIGIFFGSWDKRTKHVLGTDNKKRARQETHDRQIMKCPATVLMLAEASLEVEQMLKEEGAEGSADAANSGNPTNIWWCEATRRNPLF